MMNFMMNFDYFFIDFLNTFSLLALNHCEAIELNI